MTGYRTTSPASLGDEHDGYGDLVDTIMAGEPLMIVLTPAHKRAIRKEIAIRKAVEAAEIQREIARRLGTTS